MKNPLLIFITLLVMGIIMLFIGIFEFSNRINLSKNGLRAEGTVIELKRQFVNRKVSYSPKIEFTTNTGKTVAYVYPTSSNPPAYSIGQRVNIIYSEDNPKNFILDTKSVIFVFPVILILAGIIIILLDIGITVKKRKTALHPVS